MVRPLNAAIVSSTKPLSFSVSVWIITGTSKRSATDRQQSIAAGVVPQSSCSFIDDAPARSISSSAAGREALPLAEKARFTGSASAACSMRARCHGPGVQVVADGAGGRPGAAAAHGGDAGGQRLLDLLRADEVDVRVDAAGGEDLALPGDDLGARADDDVDAGLHVRVAGLADAATRPFRMATSAFTIPQWSTISALVMTVSTAPSAWLRWDWPMPSRITLPPPNFTSSPYSGQVALDLDEQLGIGQAHAVAGGGAIHVGIGAAGDASGHSAPITSPRKP